MILVTQDMFDDPKLNRIIISNSSVKVVGKNSTVLNEKLAKEIGVSKYDINQLKKHQFRIQAGDKTPVLVKPKNIL